MATIGRGVLAPPVFEFFEGLRTFDAARAVKPLAEDALFESPWSGRVVGREKVQEFLAGFLGDVKARPSFSVIDVAGDGNIVRLRLSVSGRFGRAPQHVELHALCVQGIVHQVVLRDAKAVGH